MTSNVDTACLLVGGPSVTLDFSRAVKRMVDETGIDITRTVIATSTTDGEDDGGNRGVLSTVEKWGPVRKIKSSLVQPEPYVEVASLSCVSPDSVRRCVVESTEGVAVFLPDVVVDDVAAHCDVVVHEGVGILSGRILTAPDQGVLSFHHGDIREYRGIGHGFWEYMHGEDRSGVTLQRLNETLDGGEIIAFREVDISDAHTYPEIRRRLGRAAVPMLATGIRCLRDPDFSPEVVPEEELGTMYYSSMVDLPVRAQYLSKELLSRVERVVSW